MKLKIWLVCFCLAIISCKKDEPIQPQNSNNPSIDSVLTVPLLITPVQNDSILNKRPNFVWTKSKNAIAYDLQVSLYNNFPDTSINIVNTSDTLFSFSFDLPVAKLFWRVRAVRQATVSSWSTTQSFTIYDTSFIATSLIDGILGQEENYTLLGTYGPGKNSTGFGNWGAIELYAKHNATTVTLFVVGTGEANGNNLVLYLGSSGVAGGIGSGSQLPSADDIQGPFVNSRPILDFECDMGIRLAASGDNGGSFYMSAVNYSAPVASSYIDAFLGNHLYDLTKTVTQERKMINGSLQPVVTTFNNIRTAYSHTGNLDGNTALDKGWEIEIPRSSIGLTAAGELKILFAYISGAGDFWSANTIPAKPGNGSTNLAGNPNLVITGTDMHIDYAVN